MEVCKKTVVLGLTLLAFCVLAEAMGFCKFGKMFPTQPENVMIQNDTSQADNDNTETSNSNTAKNVGKTLTDNGTTTGKEIFETYKISPQAVTDHLGEYTTAVRTEFDEHSATSPAAAEGITLACGDTSTVHTGVLTSPNWPGFYDNNVECEYIIQGSLGQTVALSFDSFDLEGGSSCEFDYVEIRDGASSSSTLLAKLCGPKLPRTYNSSGSNLYVKLFTDSTENYGGFSASYTLQ